MVNGQTAALTATTAILDSGTTAILVSSSDAAAIHQVLHACSARDLHQLGLPALRASMSWQQQILWQPACAGKVYGFLHGGDCIEVRHCASKVCPPPAGVYDKRCSRGVLC